MKIVLIFLAVIAIALAEPIAPFRYTAVTSTNFNGRTLRFKEYQGANALGVYFASVQRQRTGQGQFQADGVQGLIYQYGLIGPTAALAFWENSGSISNTSTGWDLDVSGAAAFLATRHHAVVEWNPTTKSIDNTELLGTYNWVVSNQSYSPSLSYLSILGTTAANKLRVEFTFIAASELGNITVSDVDSGTYLPPKAIEQLVGIDTTNYVYKSDSNFLVLVSYVVTGEAQLMANFTPVVKNQPRTNIVVSGSGSASVAYKTNGKVVAISGGSTSFVDVNVTLNGSRDFNAINGAGDIVRQVQAKYNAAATINRVEVNFHKLPGFKGILRYDPTTINGEIPDQVGVTSGAISATFSLTLLFTVFCLCILF